MRKHDRYYYTSRAEQAGCKVDFPSQKVIEIHSPDNSSVLLVPAKIKDDCVECAIIKWFKRFGILLSIFLVYLIIASII